MVSFALAHKSLQRTGQNMEQFGKKTYPTPLKAVLRTEEAVFYAQLETGRTLQSPGIIVAIEADTFALGCFRAHIGGIASAEDSRRLTR